MTHTTPPRLAPLVLAVFSLSFAACAHDGDDDLRFLSTPALLAGNAPYSEAVRAGDLLFLTGKLGIKPGESAVVPGGVGPETRQTLENIKDALNRYGAEMEDVVKCTVFLADIAEWSAMNEVYKTYFPGNPPARSAVGISGLARDARVEIECIAYVGDDD